MKILKRISNFFIIFFSLFIVIMGSGLIYEAVSESRDLIKYPAPGKIIGVDEHNMHIYSEGYGPVTVVFTAGWGIECPYVEYSPIYSKLSQHTRIAVYDRPGYGWSEISKSSRNIDVVTNELHKLLELSGEKPPYILVGHSMSSLEVIRFAQRYSNEVKGIVLLDAGNPDYYANQDTIQGELHSFNLKAILQKTGIMRLLFKNEKFIQSAYAPRNNFRLMLSEMAEMDKALYLHNLTNKNKNEEILHLRENAEIVAEGSKLGNIPLRIFTAEKSDTEEMINFEWIKSQKDFLTWSHNSNWEIVKNGNHYFYQFTPQTVIDSILEIVHQ